ncbi:unnamed protein product [Tuber melanosporum]|uniref:(Perigord truffle) hypothetical protein n=1 Tax=Tuber melanosporum (strain Mel28) TaxID=656061 RepID=D5GMI0_TUBMM|nr:uncharacterized protein GSTUM_00010737001 [Tuber melanosporum]CAZ85723.1 unnamed protein product [Tuber melanosporum]
MVGTMGLLSAAGAKATIQDFLVNLSAWTFPLSQRARMSSSSGAANPSLSATAPPTKSKRPTPSRWRPCAIPKPTLSASSSPSG